MRKQWVMAVAVLAGAAFAAWVAVAAAAPEQKAATKVNLQLKWVTQAQFAGYYAALEKGYYDKEGLDVTIKVGGPSITPETVVAGKRAEFGVDWLPSLLATREKGSNLVSIAQVFARSGMTELTWRDSGIDTIKKMRGKKVGVWCCGNEPELFAALNKNGIDPKNPNDVTIVNQPFDMQLFLKRQVDAAAAMTYNELAQVLETKNPKTGKLYTMKDLNVFMMSDPKVGTGMLEDNLFVRGDWIAEKANQATAVKFLKASFKGWVYCRDHRAECVSFVLKSGSLLGKGHQTWMMNEINALIWPNPKGIGLPPAGAVAQTTKIAKTYGVITKTPKGATNYAYAARAVAQLKKEGVDVLGKKWKKAVVKVTPGGK
ncbi:MAG: ABC transporter substrate-binding protein [Gaiella sp.]|nr:ABC transporter substrate-binding protein [Gaiella sp.]